MDSKYRSCHCLDHHALVITPSQMPYLHFGLVVILFLVLLLHMHVLFPSTDCFWHPVLLISSILLLLVNERGDIVVMMVIVSGDVCDVCLLPAVKRDTWIDCMPYNKSECPRCRRRCRELSISPW
jgi:hypothetical protein